MASLALSTGVPALASAAPANDTAADWTADPRARRLLASIATNPPALVEHQARYGRSCDRWLAYTGYRAEALEAIRTQHGERIHTAYMLDGGDATLAAFDAWCRQPTATQAIDAVVEG